MILVTGSILAREDTFDDVLRSCLEHVERSRKEPGCISHDVHVDCQNPMRLFFFEQWRRCARILRSKARRRL
jgi:quinol monooxygenase YgiN